MDQAVSHIQAGQQWLEKVRERHGEATGAQVIFEHSGPMDHATVERLLAIAEGNSLEKADAVVLRKRLINVLVEALENLHRHTHNGHQATIAAICVETPQGYRIAVGNALPLATAALLSYRIGILNEMDDADLKEHYLKLLSNDARSEHGGAGIGLLTMARKSARPIHARSLPLDMTTAYFSLELAVDRS